MTTNNKLIYLVADTEAQTRFNDEKLNYKVNVELKTKRAQLAKRLDNGENVGTEYLKS